MEEPDPIPCPLDHLFLRGTPDAPALVTKAATLSYSECERAVAALAAALKARGLATGARVATWLPKTIEACLMPLAAVRAGLVHIPVNPVLRRAQVAHIMADSGAELLLTSAGRAATLEAGDLSGAVIWLEDDAVAARGRGDGLAPSGAGPDQLAAILYTSGSTGRPKGVMLSHANLWLGAISVAHYLQLAPEDRTLAVLPLGFDYGQNQLFSTWAAGGAVVPFDYLVPRDVVRAVERALITTLAAVPPLWLQLVESEWPEGAAASVRRLTNSGGALTPALINRMRATFPNADVYPMYGLTEAFRSTYLDPALVATHPTSMGKAIPFAEIMVVQDDGSEAQVNQPGELVHAGPLVAQGYWQDEQRTAERFRDAPPWSRYGGTAVWSGDTVKRDAGGLLYFVGREDEMIKTSGHRVSPLEIEEAAMFSGVVAEAVAHGIYDERLGQAIRLVARGDAGKEAILLAHLKVELPGHMQPRVVEWRDELPRNANGKIDRAAIRAEVVQ
ncbi:MAG: acyl-CoA ligase (AMP-forming), exosortase system-associated [Sphingomonadales bacterium]|nr:acyl-CoA ligase (AMP-forming), exosortase system-associated [Sphingomonadales bacterium]